MVIESQRFRQSETLLVFEGKKKLTINLQSNFFFQSLIYHTLGLTTDRNKSAHEYRQLEEIYPTPMSFFASF